MANIRPSADLRNHYKEISEFCKNTNEPVYITVNGREDTAVISASALDELYKTIELMQKINVALTDLKTGRVLSAADVKKELL